MPELGPVEGFSRRVAALERRYTKEVLRKLRDHRSELVDLVSRVGISHQLLAPLVQQMNQLGQEVSRVGNGYKADLVAISRKNAGAQLDNLRSVQPTVPGIETVSIAAAGQVERVAAMLTETPAWVSSYYSGIVTEVNRLRAAQEAEEIALSRLFAERVTDRASVYRLTRNAAAVASDNLVWTTAGGIVGAFFLADDQSKRAKKQAIAAIDERTTDCCLRVHGQIVDLEGSFELVGTPRFSRWMHWSPFHWRCRTSVSLYHPAFEEVGIPTKEMRTAARSEINARQRTGKRKEIHPAHSTSRREG